MYRITRKKRAADRRFAAMRKAELGDSDVDLAPPYQPPELRRVVVVIDYDMDSPRIDTFRLYRTNRIDSYHVEHNRRPIGDRIGWANFCKRLSAHFPRLISPYSL